MEVIDNEESIAHGHAVDTSPSEAKKDSENYRKAHVRIDGMAVSIENPLGTFRRGVSRDGTAWESEMFADYGYLKGTEGFDREPDGIPGKDALDVFIAPGYQGGGGVVYIINQVDPVTGKFDEHKCVLGAGSAKEAKELYLGNYDKNWKGCDSVVARSLEDFKSWAYSREPRKGAIQPYTGWVGVDLDATLARYDSWKGKLHIGDPIPAMVKRVKNWLAAGRDVRIFTARAHMMSARVKSAIEKWLQTHIGRSLPITNSKDPGMSELWDDRAVSVARNRGTVATTPKAAACGSTRPFPGQASLDTWSQHTDDLQACLAESLATSEAKQAATPVDWGTRLQKMQKRKGEAGSSRLSPGTDAASMGYGMLGKGPGYTGCG